MIAYALLLGTVSIIANVQGVSQGDPEVPQLGGSDGGGVGGYYDIAVQLSKGEILENLEFVGLNYYGYPVVLAYVFQWLAVDLIVGLLLNSIITVLAVLLLYRSVSMGTGDARCAFFAIAAFMLCTTYISFAGFLLKDSFIVLGFALLQYGLTSLNMRRSAHPTAYAALFGAILIFGTMRLPLLALVPLSFIVLQGDRLRRLWPLWILGILAIIGLGRTFLGFTSHEIDIAFVRDVALENGLLQKAFDDGASQVGIVGRLIGDYDSWSIFRRLALSPLTLTIQYLLPFNFLSTEFATNFFVFFFAYNLNILWCLVVGPLFIYALINYRRIDDVIARRMLLLGFAMYALVAFAYGGVTPRYASPCLVLVFPALGCCMRLYVRDREFRLRMRTFFERYYLAFAFVGITYLIYVIV